MREAGAPGFQARSLGREGPLTEAGADLAEDAKHLQD